MHCTDWRCISIKKIENKNNNLQPLYWKTGEKQWKLLCFCGDNISWLAAGWLASSSGVPLGKGFPVRPWWWRQWNAHTEVLTRAQWSHWDYLGEVRWDEGRWRVIQQQVVFIPQSVKIKLNVYTSSPAQGWSNRCPVRSFRSLELLLLLPATAGSQYGSPAEDKTSKLKQSPPPSLPPSLLFNTRP